MTEPRRYNETVDYVIYETATHRFKVKEFQLKELAEKKNAKQKLQEMVQKRMAQIVKTSSGKFWQESFNDIYSKVVQDYFKDLDDDNVSEDEDEDDE